MPNRFYINTLWFKALENVSLFADAVQRTKDRGFNTVSIDLPWGRIETAPETFDFAWIDERVEKVISARLNIQFRLNTGYSKPGWLDDKLGPDIYMIAPEGDSWQRDHFQQLSYARLDTVETQTAFYYACAAHYSDLNRLGRVMDYSAATDCCMESEYKFLDVSAVSQADFLDWLKAEYSSPAELSEQWGVTISSWDETNLIDAHRADRIRYRTARLRRFFELGAEAVHSADAQAKFGVQLGSIWDGMSARRGSYNVSEILEGVDWLHVADTPYYDHHYSMDACKGMAPDCLISNEGTLFHYEGYEKGRKEPDSRPLPTKNQADELHVKYFKESFERGANGYFLCNWQHPFIDNELDGWTYFERNAALIDEIPQCPAATKAIFISSWDLYSTEGVDSSKLLADLYNELSENRTQAVHVVNEGVFLNRPERWASYPGGVFFSKHSKHVSDEFAECISKASVPLYAESEDVGSLTPFGKSPKPLDIELLR